MPSLETESVPARIDIVPGLETETDKGPVTARVDSIPGLETEAVPVPAKIDSVPGLETETDKSPIPARIDSVPGLETETGKSPVPARTDTVPVLETETVKGLIAAGIDTVPGLETETGKSHVLARSDAISGAETRIVTLKVTTEEKSHPVLPVRGLSRKLSVGKFTHIFLSHNWTDDEEGRDNHERVSRINKALKERGFITWFDEERMKGQIRQKMTEGIERSHTVVVCITKVYQEKINSADRADNCYFEFDFACRKLANHMIPVVMEPFMLNKNVWNGRLDSELGGLLYIDMSKNEESVFERKCDELAEALTELIGEV
jgi:hypothetical protein